MVYYLSHLALPDNVESGIQSKIFEADYGTMATLYCPIPPGTAHSRYYVRWIDASDTTRIVGEIIRPSRVGRDTATFLNERYSVNGANFSLNIRDVRILDGDITYRCVTGVEDYVSNIEYLYDEETEGITQTLVVNSK